MDIGIVAAIAMLAVWAVGTFAFEAPGWIHGLLSVGVFLLIWRVVALGTAKREMGDAKADKGKGKGEKA